MDDDEFTKLLKRSSLGDIQATDTPRNIAWPDAFRDPFGGRVWHAHHRTAEQKYHHCASSLCGINLIQSVTRLEGPFPPTNQQHRPCSRCDYLSCPETLPIPAFVLLQWLVAGRSLVDVKKMSSNRAINQLIQRDLIEGSGIVYRPTRLGWLNVQSLRKHPAYDPALFAHVGRTM